MQKPDGSAVWLRLSTRALEQKPRPLNADHVIAGAHWLVPPAPGAQIALAYQGPVAPEAEAAFAELAEESPGAGLLAITSPDRLHAGWTAALRARREGDRTATCHIEQILAPLAPGAPLVTILDGHPAAHSWLGAVRGQRVIALGPEHFGESADIPDLYRKHRMDTDAILDACAQALLA
jgi:pyruvate dehydrogenase E1 component